MAFKEFLMQSLLRVGKVFAFGPVNAIVSFALDWVLGELLDLLEDWVKYQVTIVLVAEDFDELREAFKARDELESKEGATDEELDEMDQRLRDAARNAFRVGRV